MPRFTARRSYRPRAMLAGLGFLVACGVLAAVLALEGQAEIAPYVAGAGVLGYFVATIVAMIPQQVSLELAGRTLAPSWRGPLEVERVEVGPWVLAGIDAATGLAVTLRGRGGTLRIGGERHAGEGYRLGAPTRSVDCHLPPSAFDDLVGALGVVRGDPGPLAVPLVRSSQSFGGVVRTMAPWLVTITVIGTLGVVAGNTQLVATFDGQLVLAAICGGIALAGMGWMVVRGRRVRMPELELRDEPDALVIDDLRGHAARIAWPEITVERLTHTVTSRIGSYAMPVLVLGLPGRKPLRLGAWDTQLAWPGQSAKTWRGPAWIVGAAKWPALLDALRRHGRL